VLAPPGTAIVQGKKGQHVWTDGKDEEALSRGVFDTYVKRNLRYSQARSHALAPRGRV
jgi:fumarate hydratase class I